MKSLTTRLLLFLSMPLLLLCACHTTCPVGPQGSSELPSESALQPLALPEDAHVLAFDREHILFCRQENASDESAHGLYRYDVAVGETVRLWGYPAPAYSGDAAVLRGQDLYLLTEGAVCQVDVSSCAATEIAEVPTEAMVSLHAMDNGLVLHSILSEENGGLTYLVETLSLPEGQRRTVAKEQVRDNSGTAISCVAAQGETLYRENPPEFIYFLTLYHLFRDFMEDDEDNGIRPGLKFEESVPSWAPSASWRSTRAASSPTRWAWARPTRRSPS